MAVDASASVSPVLVSWLVLHATDVDENKSLPQLSSHPELNIRPLCMGSRAFREITKVVMDQ